MHLFLNSTFSFYVLWKSVDGRTILTFFFRSALFVRFFNPRWCINFIACAVYTSSICPFSVSGHECLHLGSLNNPVWTFLRVCPGTRARASLEHAPGVTLLSSWECLSSTFSVMQKLFNKAVAMACPPTNRAAFPHALLFPLQITVAPCPPKERHSTGISSVPQCRKLMLTASEGPMSSDQ